MKCVTQEDELLFEFLNTVSLSVRCHEALSSLTLHCMHLTLQLSFAHDMHEMTERHQIMVCLRTRQASHAMIIQSLPCPDLPCPALPCLASCSIWILQHMQSSCGL